VEFEQQWDDMTLMLEFLVDVRSTVFRIPNLLEGDDEEEEEDDT
jgi:hypothetical protein